LPFSAPLAMAFVDETISAHMASEPTMVVVRNTFIHVCPKPQMNRCNSLPAMLDAMTLDGANDAAPLPSKISAVSMDASTDASGESKETVDVEESPPPSPHVLAVPTAPWTPAIALTPKSSNSGEGLGRSPLSSKAKAWTPISTEAKSGAISFHTQAQLVIEEVQAAVRLFRHCAGAEFCWGGPGRAFVCTLTALLPAELSYLVERLLSTAKEAIIAAAAKSTGVFLIGCRQMPFTAMPQGFYATLGEMCDQSQACWSMYNRGFCNRNGECRWKHPQASVSFNFTVALAATAPCLMYTPSPQQEQQEQQEQQQQPQQQPQPPQQQQQQQQQPQQCSSSTSSHFTS